MLFTLFARIHMPQPSRIGSWIHEIPLLGAARFAAALFVIAACLNVEAGERGTMRDVRGEEELAADTDPSFASVASHFPPMQFPREAIGVKDGRNEFIVRADGGMQVFSPGKVVGFAVGDPPIRFGTGEPIGRRLLGGYLPIVILSWNHDGVKYEQTHLAWSKAMSPDEQLWGYLRLKATNSDKKTKKIPLRFSLYEERYQGQKKISSTAHLEHKWMLELAPGQTRDVYVKLPESFQKGGASETSAKEFGQRLAEAGDQWRALLNRGMRIETPEQQINNAYRAWLAYTFLNVDKINGVYEPHDGAGDFYAEIYGIIASKYCRVLDSYGYADIAERYLESLKSFINTDGLFLQHFGVSDHGSFLVALDEHYRMTGDRKWLEKQVPILIKMCDWVIRERQQAKATSPKDSSVHGLLKFQPSADYPEPDYNFMNDVYLCKGLEAAASALSEVGKPREAERIRGEADSYRHDIIAAMDLAVFEHDGLTMLPVLPRSREWLKKWANGGYTAKNYYGLFASILLDSEFLPASGRHAQIVKHLMEQQGGLVLGMCAFSKGVDHAFTYGYWLTCLQCGEPKRAILGLYGSLAYGMSRNTWSGVEVMEDITTGRNHPITLPHLRSGTQQLRLLRAMLVREEGDRLVLAQAVPRPWLENGKRLAVLDAPTRFGKTSYTIESNVGEGLIKVDIDPPTRTPPTNIILHPRHPEGAKIRSVTVGGKSFRQFGDGVITLGKLAEPTIVEVRY